VLFYNLIRRGFRARLNAERALQQTNDHLESLVTERTEQLSVLSRHLIRVSEEEKAKLARELHDEMGANLTAIGLHLATVCDQLKGTHPDQAATLGRARATLIETVELKRRIVEDLRPSLLDNLGLSAALQSYCEDFGRTTRVDCEALIEGDVDGAGPTQAIALFRIAQESLNNVAKYAQARHVVVHLAREGEAFTLEVSDDGVGIPPDAMRRPKSHGLLGMRERALLLGGTLRVDRGVNGIGTTVHAIVPVTVPGSETGGTASGGALEIAALALAPSGEPAAGAPAAGAPASEAGPEQAELAAHQLHNQLRAAQAQSPLETAGRDTATLMRAIHPTADGRTRF
jgi:signal transduction histidine kinase